MKEAEQFNLRQATAADIPAMSSIRLSVRENILSDPALITAVGDLERRTRAW
ncbi:MAG TPA: hypothetical protein VF861_15735 [Telluria sp.]